MTLLTIVQGASARVGFPIPSSVIGNTDATVQQMKYLLNEEGNDLVRRYDWQVLTAQGTFTTVAAEEQVASMSTTFTGFDHIVEGTLWDRTANRQFYGPLTPQLWQEYKSSVSSGLGPWFRIRGNALIVQPNPTAGHSAYFEYVKNTWCESSGGTDQTAFAADTDVGILNEELLTKGLVWRYLKAKGLDYSEPFRQYELHLSIMSGQDGAKPRLTLAGRGGFKLTDGNIPEGNWS